MKMNLKRVFSLLLCAAMLLTLLPAAALAAEGDSYTLYTMMDGEVYGADSYDPAAPVMLPTDVERDGYVFAGWYTTTGGAGSAYVPETTSETHYYQVEVSEQSTTSPDFSSGKEYYTRAEYFTPVLNEAGTDFRKIAKNATIPEGYYVFDEDDTWGNNAVVQPQSKRTVGEVYYFYLQWIVSSGCSDIPGLREVIPEGMSSEYSRTLCAVTFTQEMKDRLPNTPGYIYYTDKALFVTAWNRNMSSGNYTLHQKSVVKTPVSASTYKSGTTVYCMDTTKTEITEEAYNALDAANRDMETITTYTGRFLPAADGTYYRTSMTPAVSSGEVSCYAGWVAAADNTYTLDYGTGEKSVLIAYDPAYPHALGTPSRPDYSFEGWMDAAGNIVTTSPDTAQSGVQYTAQWRELDKVIVTFDTGGHVTASWEKEVPIGAAVPAPTEAAWQENYVLNEGTEEAPLNYTFAGWYADKACTQKYDFSSPVEESMTLYAKWIYGSYISTVTLTKQYDRTYTDDKAIDTQGVFTENVTYTITADHSENRQVGKTEMPDITPVTISVGDGTDYVTLELPDFNAENYGIGDYWYKVQETPGNTAGVTADAHTYWMHLVVADEENGIGSVGVISYALHTDTEDGEKETGFTNTYDAGELSVTKQVTGNMGDPDKLFAVTVTFEAPKNADNSYRTVAGDIDYVGGFADATGEGVYTADFPGTVAAGWTGTKTVTVWVKDDTTVTFTNIPDGVTYTVEEADYSADGYTTAYTVDSAEEEADAADADGVTGSVSDSKDAVTITNEKNASVDVGVELSDAPFVLLLVLAGACVLLLLKKRTVRYED